MTVSSGWRSSFPRRTSATRSPCTAETDGNHAALLCAVASSSVPDGEEREREVTQPSSPARARLDPAKLQSNSASPQSNSASFCQMRRHRVTDRRPAARRQSRTYPASLAESRSGRRSHEAESSPSAMGSRRRRFRKLILTYPQNSSCGCRRGAPITACRGNSDAEESSWRCRVVTRSVATCRRRVQRRTAGHGERRPLPPLHRAGSPRALGAPRATGGPRGEAHPLSPRGSRGVHRGAPRSSGSRSAGSAVRSDRPPGPPSNTRRQAARWKTAGSTAVTAAKGTRRRAHPSLLLPSQRARRWVPAPVEDHRSRLWKTVRDRARRFRQRVTAGDDVRQHLPSSASVSVEDCRWACTHDQFSGR
jgi:hypothetical protein